MDMEINASGAQFCYRSENSFMMVINTGSTGSTVQRESKDAGFAEHVGSAFVIFVS